MQINRKNSVSRFSIFKTIKISLLSVLINVRDRGKYSNQQNKNYNKLLNNVFNLTFDDTRERIHPKYCFTSFT